MQHLNPLLLECLFSLFPSLPSAEKNNSCIMSILLEHQKMLMNVEKQPSKNKKLSAEKHNYAKHNI
jgi:hypothetical protein